MAEVQSMQRFSAFLDVLHGDLARAQELRDRTLADTEAWSAFQDNVRLLQEEGLQELTALVHLGAGAHVRGHVPDTSRVFVDVGLGFHAECSLEEALRVADTRLQHLRHQVEARSERVASIKSHIALVQQGLAGLQGA